MRHSMRLPSVEKKLSRRTRCVLFSGWKGVSLALLAAISFSRELACLLSRSQATGSRNLPNASGGRLAFLSPSDRVERKVERSSAITSNKRNHPSQLAPQDPPGPSIGTFCLPTARESACATKAFVGFAGLRCLEGFQPRLSGDVPKRPINGSRAPLSAPPSSRSPGDPTPGFGCTLAAPLHITRHG